MDINTIFERLGLSEEAGKIYVSLLKNRRLSVAGLSSDTGLYRPMVYKILPELLEKNIVSKTKVGKRTYYVAENPEYLGQLVTELKTELEKIIPELKQFYEGSKNKPSIGFFEGKKAIQHIYEDMIRRSKKGGSVYRYESPRDYLAIGNYYPALYWKHATGPDSDIEKYVITNEETFLKRRQRLSRHTKVIPAEYDTFDYNITQLIYADTVAFIDFDTETATIIKNKRFADFQLKLFKMLFKKL